ncbi:MAG TPA: response regulator [Candidatus Saccharimonadales bacterium]|nr:response regulator [Candidatus Saccharimonadales bacterium]
MKVIDDIKTILGKEPLPTTKTHEPPKTILIVEDDKILLEMYSDKFVKEGFTVITAENGKIGLEKAINTKPDIILLDLMMPIMDGKRMLSKLRQFPQFKKLPVIILTNAGEVDNIRQTQRYDNACEFLIKSNVSVDEVVEKVKFWLPAFSLL